jgi:TatD DNase family protein
MQLVDIGANLAHDSFDSDRDAVIDNAAAAGVSRLVLTGSSVDSNRAALALAQYRPGMLFSTAGMHPHHASAYDEAAHRQIRALLPEPLVVAVGECGLDYFRNFSPAAAQQYAFTQQLALAVESQLPVFLHQRDAHEDFVALLKPRLGEISRAVAHCFTGSAAELDTYLDMGLYIGITGWICDERRGQHLKDIVSRIPLDRVMIESDAPYLMPRSLAPKPASRRNEPKYLPEVLRVLADAMRQAPEALAEHTTNNARRFFGLP